MTADQDQSAEALARSVAEAVRAALEDAGADRNTSWDARNLQGACGIAALAVCRCLDAEDPGGAAVFVAGDYKHPERPSVHCWTVYRGFIVDTTATQFDPSLPPARIVRPDQAPEYFEQARGDKAPELLASVKWDDMQDPFLFGAGHVERLVEAARAKRERKL